MAVSPEVHIPASELSLRELKSQARRALTKKQEGLELEHREDRARENLATVENILQIPEVDAYLSRTQKEVQILKVKLRNPSGIRHRYFLYTKGVQLFLQRDYLKRRLDGWLTDYVGEVKSDDDLTISMHDVFGALSELSARGITKKFQRALSSRVF